MGKFRPAQILGASILTPALTGLPQNAAARSVDMSREAEICSADLASSEMLRADLAAVLFSLSPAEKRAIAGDRIRTSMPRMRLAVETTGPACGKAGALQQKAAGTITVACGGNTGTCNRAQTTGEAHPMVRTPSPPKVSVTK